MRLLINVFLLIPCTLMGQNYAELLGYPKDTKLLIIHADDAGMSHSENIATIESMEDGSVNSASIMVPCPWFTEMANYAADHVEMDFGVHLTVTSEWSDYKWGPVSLTEEVSSLANTAGYFYPEVSYVAMNASVEAVALEASAQVQMALDFGIDVTHLDAHMFGLMHPKFLSVYVNVGRQYRVPILLTQSVLEGAEEELVLTDRDVVVDKLWFALPEHFKGNFEEFYTSVLEEIEPGLNVVLLHPAFDDEEMQAITVSHPNWGAAWRQADYDFFTSHQCVSLLDENDIQLVTWREIRDKVVRR